MHHYVLIACASKKRPSRAPAGDFYLGDLFRKSLRYAESARPHGIFILSAKHGLLHRHEEIEPYDLTLNRMPIAERKVWADRVLLQLKGKTDVKKDRFKFLAGKKYREHLIPSLCNCEVPMEGLGIGKQLQFLDNSMLHG